ncbi:ParB/RepB/Spo0J family partition protein [Flavobacterium sp.]|uniref:ParB/RepB/Spo0J family partition protein n=1 Tax=Flavobacterium sp. TaxID=239 RepID=UPI002630A3C2|nr:ParB/RepB/Spo0J family partition protein [Flavobacterium sp.]
MTQNPETQKKQQPGEIQDSDRDLDLDFSQPVQRDLALENFTMEVEKGQSIKATMKACNATSGENWQLPIDKIVVIPNFNPRVQNERYHARIKVLAQSILNEGFYAHKPISVALMKLNGADCFVVKDGHRRLEAAKLAVTLGAKIEKLPVVASKDGTSFDELNWEVLQTAEAERLTTYEKAIQVRRFLTAGYSQSEIAERSGYSITAIGNMVKLIEAPKAIQNLISEGKLSSTLAVETLTQHGMQEGSKVLLEAAAKAPKEKKVTKKTVRSAKPKVDSVLTSLAPSMKKILEEVSETEDFQKFPTRLKDSIITVLSAANKTND